jgi:hypothetical protein
LSPLPGMIVNWDTLKQRLNYMACLCLTCSQSLAHWTQTFTVELDTKYIKGMLQNPDIHPNAAVNRWIVVKGEAQLQGWKGGNEYGRKLCSKTQAQGIYSTHRTATERENLGIWARDSLYNEEGCSKVHV